MAALRQGSGVASECQPAVVRLPATTAPIVSQLLARQRGRLGVRRWVSVETGGEQALLLVSDSGHVPLSTTTPEFPPPFKVLP